MRIMEDVNPETQFKIDVFHLINARVTLWQKFSYKKKQKHACSLSGLYGVFIIKVFRGNLGVNAKVILLNN